MRTLRTMYILTLACAALPLSGCMGGSTSSGSGSISLEQQVQQQDVQLRQLQPAQADAWNQIQTLRQEVNALKGQIDALGRHIASGFILHMQHITPQRSMKTPAFEWHPVLMAWAHACEKSRGTDGHEPPGKSSVSANREKP